VTLAAWLSVFVASLVGSVHCAAMCGGFVAAYAGGEDEGAGRRVASHVAYNGGRLVTYVALGAAAGALGRALDLAGRAAGLAHAAGIVTGALLLVTGVIGLAPRTATGLVQLKAGPTRGLANGLSRLLVSFRRRPARVRAAILGLSSTLLPCGWLYAFAAFAASTGKATAGAWLMSAFWAGSLPVMLGVGVSLQTVTVRFKRLLPRLRSVLVLGVGTFTLLSRLQVSAFASERRPAVASAGATPPSAADCPCHQRAHR
jgi:sulfite exporter TauE/SafE